MIINLISNFRLLIPTQIKSLRQYFYPCLGGILGGIFTPTEASAVAADDITVGDAAISIATSSGDIVFKSNGNSGTDEFLTFKTKVFWSKRGRSWSFIMWISAP